MLLLLPSDCAQKKNRKLDWEESNESKDDEIVLHASIAIAAADCNRLLKDDFYDSRLTVKH